MVAAAAAVLVTTNALAARPPADQRRAGVEAEPAEPQQAGAQHGHRHVMRLHALAAHGAAADEDRHDQGRDARADVDDGAAGEVERAAG